MGAIRMIAETVDKNITIIHKILVHQLISREVKSSILIIRKSIIKTFL